MKDVINSFWKEGRDAFERSFKRHKEKILLNRKEYLELVKEKNKIYEKYPKIKEFIENTKPTNFEKDEAEAFKRLVDILSKIKTLELLESFKLGAREAYAYFESMDMFNIT